jgi:hypothetical protein
MSYVIINKYYNFAFIIAQLWYVHRPPEESHMRARAYSSSDAPDNISPETMKLNVGISSNGDVDVGEISLTDMDPEDIRVTYPNINPSFPAYDPLLYPYLTLSVGGM